MPAQLASLRLPSLRAILFLCKLCFGAIAVIAVFDDTVRPPSVL